MTHNEPVLFLDIDGVLRWGSDTDEFIDDFGPAFDPEKCEYIARLQQQTNCRIVIISSWINRCEGGIQAMQRMAQQRNLPFTIHDTIKTIDQGGNKSRSDMMNDWLLDNGRPSYCVIDDGNEDFVGIRHRPYHVRPHFLHGMTEEHYFQALALLTPMRKPFSKPQP